MWLGKYLLLRFTWEPIHVITHVPDNLTSVLSVDTCTQDYKLQKLLEAYQRRSAMENEQQPLRAMTVLNTMVEDFLQMYQLVPVSIHLVSKIGELAACNSYHDFFHLGQFGSEAAAFGLMLKTVVMVHRLTTFDTLFFSITFGRLAQGVGNWATVVDTTTKHG